MNNCNYQLYLICPEGGIFINMNKSPWSIYIVECSDGTFYCGISNNVPKRIATHNAGKGARYTKTRLPVALKYIEGVGTMGQALKREREIKGYSRKKKEALCNG